MRPDCFVLEHEARRRARAGSARSAGYSAFVRNTMKASVRAEPMTPAEPKIIIRLGMSPKDLKNMAYLEWSKSWEGYARLCSAHLNRANYGGSRECWIDRPRFDTGKTILYLWFSQHRGWCPGGRRQNISAVAGTAAGPGYRADLRTIRVPKREPVRSEIGPIRNPDCLRKGS